MPRIAAVVTAVCADAAEANARSPDVEVSNRTTSLTPCTRDRAANSGGRDATTASLDIITPRKHRTERRAPRARIRGGQTLGGGEVSGSGRERGATFVEETRARVRSAPAGGWKTGRGSAVVRMMTPCWSAEQAMRQAPARRAAAAVLCNGHIPGGWLPAGQQSSACTEAVILTPQAIPTAEKAPSGRNATRTVSCSSRQRSQSSPGGRAPTIQIYVSPWTWRAAVDGPGPGATPNHVRAAGTRVGYGRVAPVRRRTRSRRISADRSPARRGWDRRSRCPPSRRRSSRRRPRR
jgi:hypothetical protein